MSYCLAHDAISLQSCLSYFVIAVFPAFLVLAVLSVLSCHCCPDIAVLLKLLALALIP